MKKFLAVAAFLALIAAPAMAEDQNVMDAADAVVVETTVTEETTAVIEGDEAQIVTETVTTTDVNVTAVTEACTKETNEKVKLPEGASEAEQAQWDAALAECLKSNGVPAAE